MKCPSCKGKGKLLYKRGTLQYMKDCHVCYGTGLKLQFADDGDPAQAGVVIRDGVVIQDDEPAARAVPQEQDE